MKERNERFLRGRLVPGTPSAELRCRAYQAKIQLRAQRAAVEAALPYSNIKGSWNPLGPAPLASDATGNGTQDYRQVSGRATAVVIDPADTTGNTVYVGGGQSGIWKSSNAAAGDAGGVLWAPLTDDQATLSIGAIAIQPGNSDPAKTVILAATGDCRDAGLLRVASPQPMCLQPIHGGDAGKLCGQCDHDHLDNCGKLRDAITDRPQLASLWCVAAVSGTECDTRGSSKKSWDASATLSRNASGAGDSSSLQWSQFRRWGRWESRYTPRHVHGDCDWDRGWHSRRCRAEHTGDPRRKLTGFAQV